MKILVAGGTGDFGAFYARMLKKEGFEVFISSTDEEKGRAFCEKNGFAFAGENEIKSMDIVILSVPNLAAPKVASEFAPKMKKGALLMDFCSVKASVCAELEKFSKKGLELLSVHPMHGPRVASMASQQVVFVPIRAGKKAKVIEDFFSKNGANIIYSTAKEHDEMLSAVQGLTHFSQFVSAGVLKELEVDLKRSMAFGSPNYKLFLGLISRVVLQNPELYAQIQLSNQHNEKMRESFLKNTQKLMDICKKNDAQALQMEIIRDTQEFKEPELFLLESDRLVDAQKYFIDVLKNNIGKKFLVENMLTHKFHYGAIREVTSSELVLEEGGSISRLGLNKLRPTAKAEMNEWKKKNIGSNYLDYSFLVPENVSAELLKKALSSVKGCEFGLVDEYRGSKLPAGKKSLTFRASFFADEDKGAIDKEIKEFILGLGYSFR